MKKNRNGNFSSSSIYKLTSKGRGALSLENYGSSFTTYVNEKKREKKLKRSINNTVNTRPIIIGKVIELYVFANKLDLSYSDMNEVGRLSHVEINNWTGIPDTFRKNDLVVGDIKCQSSLTKFCELIEDTELGIDEFKKNHKEYYWQLVSNAILTGVDKAELLWFVPYASELPKIKEFITNIDESILPDDLEIFQIEWIAHEITAYMEFGKKPNIAYLPDDCEYKDFNVFTFDIPQEDKDFLEARVKLANELLNEKV